MSNRAPSSLGMDQESGIGNSSFPGGRLTTSGRYVSRGVLVAATRFHGHLGPWLVLGLKAGAYARKKLGASPFELSARVFCPAGTPYTCFVDGVQFSSGCTMGKGNIRHVRAAGCRVEFVRKGNRLHHKDTKARRGARAPGRPSRVVLTVRQEVWDELHSGPDKGMAGAARLGREIARRSLSELFSERSGAGRAPTRAPRPASK